MVNESHCLLLSWIILDLCEKKILLGKKKGLNKLLVSFCHSFNGLL